MLAALTTHVPPANAGRPLETEDPGTVEQGAFELEIGTLLTHAISGWGRADLGLTLGYGLPGSVEISASVGGTALDQEGWKPDVLALALFAKWRLLGEDGESFSLALFGSGGIPTHAPHLWLHGRGYGLSGGAALSVPLASDSVARAAAIYQAQLDETDLTVGSFALEWQASEHLAAVGEAVAELAPAAANEYWALRGLVGISLAVHSSVTVDAAVGAEGDDEVHGVTGMAGVTVGF